MSAMHQYVIDLLVSERLKRRDCEHRLLVAVLHIVIRDDKAHWRIIFVGYYVIEGCRLVNYYAVGINTALLFKILKCVVG